MHTHIHINMPIHPHTPTDQHTNTHCAFYTDLPKTCPTPIRNKRKEWEEKGETSLWVARMRARWEHSSNHKAWTCFTRQCCWAWSTDKQHLQYSSMWETSETNPFVSTFMPCNIALLAQIHHHHHYQSLNRTGRWGTTDDFATSFLHFSLFSTALWDLPNSGPVHFLMLSSHLFLCPPCLLPPSLCLARWFWPDLMNRRHYVPLQFASLYDHQEIFVWSTCLLDLSTDFLVGNMVFLWDV